VSFDERWGTGPTWRRRLAGGFSYLYMAANPPAGRRRHKTSFVAILSEQSGPAAYPV